MDAEVASHIRQDVWVRKHPTTNSLPHRHTPKPNQLTIISSPFTEVG